MPIKIYVDGSCRANGTDKARAGIGIVCYSDDVLWFQSAFPVEANTNNEAEYQAVIYALAEVKNFWLKDIVIYSDSQLVVSQINGNWKIKEARLQQLQKPVAKILKDYPTIQLTWIPREENQEANKLAQDVTK